MSFKDFDRSTRPMVANEDLEQAKFKKTTDEKIAVRVGNDEAAPLFTKQVTELDAGEDFFIFDEDTAVEKDSEEIILSYQVPLGKILYLDKVSVSGESYAKITVLSDSAINKVKRSSWGSGLNVDFIYNSFRFSSETIIEVKVLNCGEDTSPYESTLEGRLGNE